jgi:hypothetical protein
MYLFLLTALLTSIAPVQAPAPNRQPQLAAAPGLTALVFGSGNSIWFSASHDNGRSFSTASEVARVAALALGRHRGPRVAISGKAIVVSAVSSETTAENGDLVAWRSLDGGRSWSGPATINDVPRSAREGLHAMAVGKRGEIATVWLDLRAPGTRLYGAYSEDGGVRWSKNVLIYESSEKTICQCCDPSLAASGDGQFSVMFRNVVDDSRDLYLTSWNLDGQISKARKLGTGSWNIDACPMDGGGVARLGNTVMTAWRRDRTVYLDEPGRPEIGLGDGKDVAIALSAKGAYVAWSGTNGIALHEPGDKQPACLSAAGSFPSLLTLSNGNVLAAWEENGKIQVKIID